MRFWICLKVIFILLLHAEQSIGQLTCSEYCVPIEDAEPCNRTTGVCLSGCTEGYTGDRCGITCTEHCLNCTALSDDGDTVCTVCRDSYYRKNSACVPCSTNCLSNSTSPLPVCSQDNGTCAFGCASTYFGPLCNKPCSATCMGRKCTRDTGACIEGCAIQYVSGDLCHSPCSTGCIGRTCEQTGDCMHGCETQTWGPTCVPCSPSCTNSTESYDQQRCNKTDGTCHYGCNKGTWGVMCESPCPENCLMDYCSRSGECSQGCVSGTWGPMCESNCSDNCLNTTCSESGECVYGCTSNTMYGGWYGPMCNVRCNPGCMEGQCDQTSGRCSCKEGITGNHCTNKQQDNATDKKGAEILPLVFIVMGLVFLAIFVFFCLYLVRRKH